VRKFLRYLGYTLGALAALLLVVIGVVYAMSERIIARTYEAPAERVVVPSDSASIAEGERLARVRGCPGCHGDRLQGNVFFDEPGVARLTAGNLTRAARRYSDAELARIIRHGVRPDGSSVFGMPSPTFFHLNDEDLGRIIAWVRSMPEVEGPDSRLEARMMGRIGLVTGLYKPISVEVDSAEIIARLASPDSSHGRYLALSICTECHGQDLKGSPMGAPGLSVAKGYSLDAFERLLRTGVAADGTEKGLMSEVAKGRFVNLDSVEIRQLHEYLSRQSNGSSQSGLSSRGK
jgi:mono/diheme cytochrome c family protein